MTLKNLQSICLSMVWLVALATMVAAAEHTKDPLPTVKKSVAEKMAVLVDVREKSEWDQGHIAGAERVSLSEPRQGINPDSLQKQLPRNRIVYTYCAVGKRSLQAAEILQKQGYDVRPLKAGYTDLLQAGFPKAEK